MDAPYPWQTSQWQRLTRARADTRLAHAYLLEGPGGIGKTAFARALGRLVLCTAPAADGACGACRACRLLEAGSHPDYVEVAPEEGRNQILIEQIRGLTASLALRSQQGGYKVALIHPADALNSNAANALLKTLEEPAPETLLLLIADHPQRLPATIRSRCQRLPLPPPDRQAAARWLAEFSGRGDAEALLTFAGNAPLLAMRLGEDDFAALDARLSAELVAVLSGEADPVDIAASWHGLDVELVLRWLTMRTQDLIRARAGRPTEGLDRGLGRYGGRLDLNRLFSYLDFLYRSTLLLRGQVNRQQLLETLLTPWAHGLRQPIAVHAEDLVSGRAP